MAMRRKNYGVLIAAVSAAMLGSSVNADVLLWDSSGAGGAAPVDGTGGWDTATTNWVNAGVNVTWTNGSSAVFGTGAFDAGGPDTSFAAVLATDIVAQDITLGTSAGGGFYNIIDTGGAETLTITGNVTKNSNKGGSQIFLTNALTLSAGNHVFALRDTGGDLAELTFNSSITGAGSITVNNTSAGDEQYGTLLLTVANSYSGGTTITKGRVAITNQGALGSGGVVIEDAGALAFGGGGTDSPGLNITTPITITRSDYTTFNHTYYGAAIIASNDGTNNTHTISGPLIVDSTDARIQVDTNTVVISSNIQQGPNVTAGVLTVGGDFAGHISLTGNNTALLGGIKIIGGVELDVDNHNSLGGVSSPLTFAGSGTLHPIGGFMTNFGTHVLNNATFSGGIDVDATKTFTIDQALGQPIDSTDVRVGSLGKRGLGTMNINSPVNLRGGQTFWDAGVVNVNSTVQLANLHLRSSIVNIGTGGSILTDAGYSSFGQDSTGTNGGPDIAVINITGTGSYIQTNNDDFNISDNANTQGTINLSGNGVLTTSGITHLGKQPGATGTINQSGGTLTVQRNGNFAFVVGRDSGQGVYNLSGGTFSSPGEVYVGQGFGNGSGHGQWNQTGGTATISNWFVIGRENGAGDVDISGGTLIKNSGGNTPIGEGGAGRNNSFMIRGTGTFDAQTGEVWVSNGGNNTTVMTVKDSGTLNVNDWFVIGRGGGTNGTMNVANNATVTKAGGGNFLIGDNGGTGTVNQTGGAVTHTTGETWLSSGGNGTYNLSAGSATFGLFDVGHTGGGSAFLNVSGTGAFTATTFRVGEVDSVNGTVNLSGGSIKANTITSRNSSGTKTFNWTGGTLSVGSYQFPSDLNNGGTGVLAPGGVGTVGTTAITAGYQQSSLASLAIDIAGDASFDVVTAGGTSVFNGTLSVDVLGAYNPVAISFDVLTLTAGTLTGTPTLGGPDASLFTLSIIGGNTLRLTSVAQNLYGPGDVNHDHIVDQLDLNLVNGHWQQTGVGLALGDANQDGIVDQLDLNEVNGHWQQTTAGRGLSVVPEPTSLAILGLAGFGLMGRRRRA